MNQQIESEQISLCARYGVTPFSCPETVKLGISKNIKEKNLVIHGLRCNPQEGTSGWFIWAGDWSDAEDFFVPLHVKHMVEWCPIAVRFLQLPPGWRFLVDADYEDVWADPKLKL